MTEESLILDNTDLSGSLPAGTNTGAAQIRAVENSIAQSIGVPSPGLGQISSTQFPDRSGQVQGPLANTSPFVGDLPTEGATIDSNLSTNQTTVAASGLRNFKVFIEGPGGVVVFEASAPLTEGRTSNYDDYAIVHLPTQIWAYRNTSGRHFTIQGKLVSRTPNEAATNAFYLDLVRRWVLPDFGGSGATPPIVRLSGYLDTNIDRLTCVIKSYGWTYDEQTDYITNSNRPMPVIGNLIVELDEVYTPTEVTNQKWMINAVNPATGNPVISDFELGASFQLSSVVGRNFPGIATAAVLRQAPTVGSVLGSVIGGVIGAVGGVLGSVGRVIGGVTSPIFNNPVPVPTFPSFDPRGISGGITETFDQARITNNPYISGISPSQVGANTQVRYVPGGGPSVSSSVDGFKREFSGSSPPDFIDF